MIELVLRIVFSLLVVLGLMWGLARLARRPLTGRGGGALHVLTRQQLTRGSSIAVVRVVDRALIVGITEGQVTLLSETDLAAVELELAGPAAERRATVALDAADGEHAAESPVQPAGAPTRAGRLDGSLLSPRTWAATLDFLRERTVRR